MGWLRRTVGKLLRTILPDRWVRILRRPALVPGEYRWMIDRAEYVKALLSDPKAQDEDYWVQMLRMYAHILDKGIQQCDFEPGHGSAAVGLARGALNHIQSSEWLNEASVVWARERIAQYERLQAGEPCIRKPVDSAHNAEGHRMLLSIIKGRRSIRSYRKESVDVETIEKIVETFNWSPWSCHRQTGKVFVANDPGLAAACLATCKGGTGFSEFVPCFMSFCADLRPYNLPAEIWIPMVDVGLGTENCCLTAHSLGMSLTLLSWAQRSREEDDQLRKLLDVPEHYEIVVNGVLGYPDYAVDIPARKSIGTTYLLRPGSKTE